MSYPDNKNQIWLHVIGGITFAGVWLMMDYFFGDFRWPLGILGGAVFAFVGVAHNKLKGESDNCQ